MSDEIHLTVTTKPQTPNLVIESPISIVITTYNGERYLGAAIESVLSQTRGDFELLIWDDGSTDDSVGIAQTYANRDSRVRVVAAVHQGRVRALKSAIAQTTGTYIGWIDHDDLLAPAALQETTAVLDANPEVGLVYTDYLDMEESGKIRGYGTRCHIPYSKERLLLDFMTFFFRLMRREVFEQVGGLDESMTHVEDYDLCLKLSEATEVRHVKKPLYYYRCHGLSASQQYPRQQAENACYAIANALKRRGLAERLQVQLEILQDVPFQSRIRLTPKPTTVRSRRSDSCVAPTGVTCVARTEVRKGPLSSLRFVACLSPLALCLSPTWVQAQTITPATDGTNTSVTSTGNQYDISGGALVQEPA
jgi:GT2 family glycosyltransferase